MPEITSDTTHGVDFAFHQQRAGAVYGKGEVAAAAGFNNGRLAAGIGYKQKDSNYNDVVGGYTTTAQASVTATLDKDPKAQAFYLAEKEIALSSGTLNVKAAVGAVMSLESTRSFGSMPNVVAGVRGDYKADGSSLTYLFGAATQSQGAEVLSAGVCRDFDLGAVGKPELCAAVDTEGSARLTFNKPIM